MYLLTSITTTDNILQIELTFVTIWSTDSSFSILENYTFMYVTNILNLVQIDDVMDKLLFLPPDRLLIINCFVWTQLREHSEAGWIPTNTYNRVWLMQLLGFSRDALWNYTSRVTAQVACGEAEIRVISWTVRGEMKGRANERKRVRLNQRGMGAEQMFIWSLAVTSLPMRSTTAPQSELQVRMRTQVKLVTCVCAVCLVTFTLFSKWLSRYAPGAAAPGATGERRGRRCSLKLGSLADTGAVDTAPGWQNALDGNKLVPQCRSKLVTACRSG